MHGEDDQIVPVKDSAKKSARLIRGAKEIYYPGAPHGMTATLQDQVNADLLAFLSENQRTGTARTTAGVDLPTGIESMGAQEAPDTRPTP
jgi:hypothetical protein